MDDISAGMVVGAPVLHPTVPDVELLKPGAALTGSILSKLRQMGVTQLWIHTDLTADLVAGAGVETSRIKLEMLGRLKNDVASFAQQTIGVGHYQQYRHAIMQLVCELIGNSTYAGLADAVFATEGGLMTHSTNVAHLSVMVGLDLETYIVRQRTWLAPEDASDMVTLGLAGMLHDIGKVRMKPGDAAWSEAGGGEGAEEPEGYRDHPTAGHQLLRESRAAARVCQTVLNHHRRYDGGGWPEPQGRAASGPPHIFTRIVSAANVLDNLRRKAAREGRPPVAALFEFASAAYDGWFDPVVRGAVLRRVAPFQVGSDIRLSDGRRAAVVLPNLDDPCRPTVRVLGAERGAKEAEQVDLSLRADLHVAQYLGMDVAQWLYEAPARIAPQDEASVCGAAAAAGAGEAAG